MHASIEVAPKLLAGQQAHYGWEFPLALECRMPAASLEAVCDWLADAADELVNRAAAHGAVLFRGFPLQTADDFDAFVAALGLENFEYEGSLSNAVRLNRTPRVFTANEAPPEVTIYLHHEMAQTPIFPRLLFFFCEQPAQEGGATPICRSDVLLERLRKRSPLLVRGCEEHGLKYSHVMPAAADLDSGMGRSWQGTFGVEDRAAAEARLRELAYTWEWQADGSLRVTTPVLPAIRELVSGRQAFFNQLIAAFAGWKDSRNDPARSVTLGDGTPLDARPVRQAVELADELTFDIPWQQGDVALVDNYVAMHGRRSFRGRRKILASLVA